MTTSKLVTGPASEPVTVAQAKVHLRVDHDADDNYIESLIVQAREYVEHHQERAILSQTWELHLDSFPAGCETPRGLRSAMIFLPTAPLQSVTHVKYYDGDGTLTTLDTDDYLVIGVGTKARGSIVPAVGLSWPTTQDRPEAVVARYVAGYADAASVPAATKQAILLMVAQAYEFREPVITGTIQAKIDFTIEALMAVDSLRGYW